MKVCKKIAAFLAATLMTASMAATSAFATDYTEPKTPPPNPNVSDTSWSAGNDYCRRKHNSTSIYVQNVSMIYTAKVTVRGRSFAGGNDEYVHGGSVGSTTGLTLPANSQRFIRQNINEFGYSYAHITFNKGNSSDNGYACGQWSPDSVGTYPTIN